MGKGDSTNAVFGSRSRKVKTNITTLDEKYYPKDWDKAIKAEMDFIEGEASKGMWDRLDKAVQEHLAPPDGSFTISQYAKRQDVARTTAKRAVTKLVEKGILGHWPNPIVSGKDAYYFFIEEE